MNFYAAQDSARRRTLWMVVLFSAAVLTLIAITNLFVLAFMAYLHIGELPTSVSALIAVFDPALVGMVALAIVLIVSVGSIYKMSVLSGGGRAVAESLGGVVVPQDSRDAVHRKILNVVEEMAIASGTPVPPVYLLDEQSINAFAAGWSPSSAVIGVTRGAVEYLSRDELQGVIAHEFSHIFNGDMRLNIRLMGVLHGILLLGIIGYYLMRSIRFAGSSRNRQGGSAVAALFGLGLGLAVIGYCGTFFGQWIKAIVSRQREYLADASAVQFTRNRNGIAGALKKIGGLTQGSQLHAPLAPEYSHAYFSQGVSSLMNFMFATHPPLKDRIKRLQPHWTGQYIAPQRDIESESRAQPQEKPADRKTPAMIAATAAVNQALYAIEKVGDPSEQDVRNAGYLLEAMPEQLKRQAHDPFAARAIVYCLLLHRDETLCAQQMRQLAEHADKAVYRIANEMRGYVITLDAQLRLPLLEMCFPALRALSLQQYRVFRSNVAALIRADKKIDINEWIIKRLVINKLDEIHGLRKPPTAKYSYIGAVKQDAELVLSFIAHAAHDESNTAKAFEAAIKSIGAGALKMTPRADISITHLDQAMDKLEQVKPLIKPRLLKAIAACIKHDGTISLTETELLRTIALTLDCPMPPLVGPAF